MNSFIVVVKKKVALDAEFKFSGLNLTGLIVIIPALDGSLI